MQVQQLIAVIISYKQGDVLGKARYRELFLRSGNAIEKGIKPTA